MKRTALTILAIAALCHSASAAFPTNATSETVDLARLRPDFGDFKWKWRGYEDQAVTFIINSDDVGQDLTGYLGAFRASADASGDAQVNYINKTTSQVTVSGSNLIFTVAYTNIPPNGTYKAELLLIDGAATNTVRSLARGTIKVLQSLYGDDSSDFTFPDSASYGSVYYADATGDPAALAAGTSGYVLTTQGSSAIPAWTAPSSIAPVQTVTAGANITVTTSSTDRAMAVSGVLPSARLSGVYSGVTGLGAQSQTLDLNGQYLNWGGDDDSYWGQISDDVIAGYMGGSAVYIWATDSFTVSAGPVLEVDGNTGPEYTWSADTNTGLERLGADSIGIIAGGSTEVSVGTSGMQLSAGATVDNIETTLTDDDTHLPTSGAVVDYALPLAGGTMSGNIVMATNDLTQVDDITVLDDSIVGLGAAAGRIEFDDQATDEVNILGANVGIGTNAPGTKFHVSDGGVVPAMTAGGIACTRSDGSGLLAQMNLISDAAGSGALSFGDSTDDSFCRIRSYAANEDLQFFTGNGMATPKVVIASDGDVGIGTNAPATLLDVNGAATVRGDVNMAGNSITNAADPVNAQDVVTKAYGDANYLGGSGNPVDSRAVTNTINMGGNSITNMTDPTADQDAATKKYVDDNQVDTNDFVVVTNTAGYLYSGGSSNIIIHGLSAPLVTSGTNVILQNEYGTTVTAISTNTSLASDSHAEVPTVKATKAYVDAQVVAAAASMTNITAVGFAATMSADQLNIANSTWTQVAFDTEYFDTDSGFDTGTYTYTFPATGIWHIAANTYWTDLDDGKSGVMRFRTVISGVTNNMNHAQGWISAAASNLGLSGGIIIQIETTSDTVSCWMLHTNGDATPDIDSDQFPRFGAVLVGGK